jgi:hypothetical protein
MVSPFLADTPAETTLKPRNFFFFKACLSKYSAIGERQVFPVQTKTIFFSFAAAIAVPPLS